MSNTKVICLTILGILLCWTVIVPILVVIVIACAEESNSSDIPETQEESIE